ncbi:ATP-binding response regulator [Saccharibacillus sacchari]|uniref:ATP-binding response regulator n=1 Tax=Saccharibacillus sacchari TaxID=456493 RepID=UPI0004BC7D23|nr:ATP-binding protein [Saccharibacillus sacchari]
MAGGNRNFFRNFAEAAGHVVDLLSNRLDAASVMVVSSEGSVSTVVKVFNRNKVLVVEGQEICFDPAYFADWTGAHWDVPVVIPQTSKHPLTQDQSRTRTGTDAAGEYGLIGFPISYSNGRKFGGLAALGAEGAFSDADLELVTSMALFLSYIAELERRNESDQQDLGRLAEDKRHVEAMAESYRGEAQAAKQSTQQKADFLAFMTHEIRNSLNGSIAMSELLATTQLTQEQKQYLDMVRSSNEFLLTLANNILDFSKLEAGKQSIDVSLFDPVSTIEDVASLMAPRAIEKRVELILDVEDGLPMFVQGDAGKLRQILLNLLGNAVKFTHKGQILVAVRQSDRSADGEIRLEITVRDTGIGIAADKLDGLFQTYYQVHGNDSKESYGGTGLGLVITRNLIELMGGRITVSSESGLGTEFLVALPFAPYAEFDMGPAAPLRLDGLRVLSVDDNASALSVLERLLSEWGAFSVGVRTAEAALEWLGRDKFDLVLLDVHFFDLARRIAALPEAPPVALLAPLGTVPDLQDLDNVRFTVFKPLRRFQLYSALSAIKQSPAP